MDYEVAIGWPKEQVRWYCALPYGLWSCHDGREVLFHHGYVPIWQRYPGRKAVRADPTEWVAWVRQEWLYEAGSEPWLEKNAETFLQCLNALADFVTT
jgi:hypothetical protein